MRWFIERGEVPFSIPKLSHLLVGLNSWECVYFVGLMLIDDSLCVDMIIE
jgi:hypothetical protein